MKTYSKMPEECTDRVAHLIKCFHPDIGAAGVLIDLISVSSGDDCPALTHQGYPAAAVIRILGPKERTMGRGDAELVIDEYTYLGLPDAEKDAMLDHELYHLELQINPKNGKVKLDDGGRPKLKLRKHDHQMGWFSEVAKRHGSASMECKQALHIMLSERQTYFEFALGGKDRFGEGVPATVNLMPAQEAV